MPDLAKQSRLGFRRIARVVGREPLRRTGRREHASASHAAELLKRFTSAPSFLDSICPTRPAGGWAGCSSVAGAGGCGRRRGRPLAVGIVRPPDGSPYAGACVPRLTASAAACAHRQAVLSEQLLGASIGTCATRRSDSSSRTRRAPLLFLRNFLQNRRLVGHELGDGSLPQYSDRGSCAASPPPHRERRQLGIARGGLLLEEAPNRPQTSRRTTNARPRHAGEREHRRS